MIEVCMGISCYTYSLKYLPNMHPNAQDSSFLFRSFVFFVSHDLVFPFIDVSVVVLTDQLLYYNRSCRIFFFCICLHVFVYLFLFS